MDDRIPHNVIIEMSGYTQYSKQCAWLDKNGIFYAADNNGQPHTTWYNFNHPTHLRFNRAPAAADDEPDFSSME